MPLLSGLTGLAASLGLGSAMASIFNTHEREKTRRKAFNLSFPQQLPDLLTGHGLDRFEPPAFNSRFANLTTSVQQNPFFKVKSRTNGRTLLNQVNFRTPLNNAQKRATQGLLNNLSVLRQNPVQRLAALQQGRDPLLGLLNTELRQNESAAIGQALSRAQRTGNLNSTAFGGALGQILNESLTRKQQNLLDVLDFQNQQARQNLSSNTNVLTLLANMAQPSLQQNANALLSSLQQADNTELSNLNRLLDERTQYASLLARFLR